MKKAFKLFGLLLAFGCSISGAKAQTFDDLRFRVEAGMTASKITSYGIGKTLLGMRAGGFVVLPFKHINLSLNTGLVLTNKGERQTFYAPFSGAPVETKTRLMYLQLPIEADFSIKLSENSRIHLAAGPYLGVGLAGRSENLVTQGNNLDLFAKDGDKTPFNRFELGAGASVGYQYSNFYIKAGAEVGLTNAVNPSKTILASGIRFIDQISRNTLAYVTLGYEF